MIGILRDPVLRPPSAPTPFAIHLVVVFHRGKGDRSVAHLVAPIRRGLAQPVGAPQGLARPPDDAISHLPTGWVPSLASIHRRHSLPTCHRQVTDAPIMPCFDTSRWGLVLAWSRIWVLDAGRRQTTARHLVVRACLDRERHHCTVSSTHWHAVTLIRGAAHGTRYLSRHGLISL